MVVVAKLTALAGKEVELEQALLSVIPQVKNEEETLVYTLHKDQSNPRVFLLYEKYKDMDALVVHSSTPYFKALFKQIRPLLDGPAEIKTYTELGGIN